MCFVLPVVPVRRLTNYIRMAVNTPESFIKDFTLKRQTDIQRERESEEEQGDTIVLKIIITIIMI